MEYPAANIYYIYRLSVFYGRGLELLLWIVRY